MTTSTEHPLLVDAEATLAGADPNRPFVPLCLAGCGTPVDDQGDICEPCFTGEA